jgi:hypothetical protein
MYEEDLDGTSQQLPFILVPGDEEMPKFLLMWEHRDTGEIEPGPAGEEMPIVESTLRQYALMDVLKSKLTASEYDRVRQALGLEPLASASTKGKAISDRVSKALSDKSE